MKCTNPYWVCVYEVTRCTILERFTQSNDVFEALTTFDLIGTTYIFLFFTDRLVCLNKSVKRQFTSDYLHLQLPRIAVGLLVEWSI